MFEIIFDPDPRNPKNQLIGVDNDAEYEQISIQLGENGEYGRDASHSAYLERGEDGFYRLYLPNLEKGHLDSFRVFSDTYNPKTVCNQVQQLYDDGHLQVHFVEGDPKPILIPAKL